MECAVPECVRSPISRGLCKQHYATAAKLVKEGRVTWSALEINGKCRPLVSGRGAAKSAVKWFEE